MVDDVADDVARDVARLDEAALRHGDGAVGRRGGQVHGVGRRRRGILPLRRHADARLVCRVRRQGQAHLTRLNTSWTVSLKGLGFRV